MENSKQFAADVTPALVLLDISGQRHPVLTADRAEPAIRVANKLYDLGGTGRTKSYAGNSKVERQATILFFYSSNNGRPTKSEIARAAKTIGRCNVVLPRSTITSGEEIHVSGTRAVVYPERPGSKSAAVPFLVSTQVWFNHNRSTVKFPFDNTEIQLVIDDINARLEAGSISLAR